MHFHTVFFDVGGTLVGGESMLRVIARHLDQNRADEIFTFLVDSFMDLYLEDPPGRFMSIKELLKFTSGKAARIFEVAYPGDEAIVDLYRNHHLQNDYLFDEVLSTLEKLKASGVKMILISDADGDVLHAQMKQFNLTQFFDGTIVSSEIEAYKPSDTSVAEARKYCREPLSGILFVGDMIVDIRTARKLGVRAALINRDGNFRHDADYHIKSLDEIFNLKP